MRLISVLRFVFSTLGGLFTMLTMGAIMGALSLGAIFFVYGRTLPDYSWIRQYAPQTVSRVYSGEGRIIDEFAGQRRIYVTAAEIPDVVKFAFVSAEDQNFYTHPGFDIRGIAAAFVDAVASRGSDLRGASTITQQLMKILFLDGSITAERKVQELILAVRVEQMVDKEKILEMYLNEIFLGRGSYGVAAAAQTYFNKTLNELSAGEAAYLAALAQRPGNLHPVTQYEASVNRRNYVLREMFQNGYIDEATMVAEQEAPLETVQSGAFESYRSSVPDLDYFSAEIRRQLEIEFGEDEIEGGGYQVRATIDPDLQIEAAHALQRALEQFDRGLGLWRGTGQTLPEETLGSEEAWRGALADLTLSRNITLENPWYPAVVLEVGEGQMRVGIEAVTETEAEPFVVPRDDISWMRGSFAENFTRGDVVYIRRMTADGDGSFIRWTLRQIPEVQGAFMAMDVNTGRVLAMQGGFDYDYSNFNRATLAERQPGSAFKPFVYAAALDSGYTPATIVVDSPIEINTPQGVWRPQNYSNTFYGPAPLRIGIEQSRNLMTIRLAQEIGIETVATYAERFGVYDDMQPVLANALGAQETTLYDLVAAYSMFANGGERVQPTLIDRVQDRFGQTVYRHDQSTCEDCTFADLPVGAIPRIQTNRDRIMNAVTAYQITSMMEGVVQRGTARNAINLPVPIAGKTGTTNDAKDVWFVGFSSNIAAGCYIGYDTPRSMNGASGGGVCAPVFQAFMTAAIQEYGGTPFRIPDGCRFINIDRLTGARLPDGASGGNVIGECFRDGEEPVFGITFDGGFAIAADLPLVEELRPVQQIENSTGGTAVVGPRATFNTLSTGGLY